MQVLCFFCRASRHQKAGQITIFWPRLNWRQVRPSHQYIRTYELFSDLGHKNSGRTCGRNGTVVIIYQRHLNFYNALCLVFARQIYSIWIPVCSWLWWQAAGKESSLPRERSWVSASSHITVLTCCLLTRFAVQSEILAQQSQLDTNTPRRTLHGRSEISWSISRRCSFPTPGNKLDEYFSRVQMVSIILAYMHRPLNNDHNVNAHTCTYILHMSSPYKHTPFRLRVTRLPPNREF